MTAWMSIGYDASRLEPLSFTLTEFGVFSSFSGVMTGCYAHWIYSQGGLPTGVTNVDPINHNSSSPVNVDIGPYLNFGDELASALTALGGATYTVVFNPVTERYTITASGGGVTSWELTSMSNSFARMLGVNSTSISSTGLVWTTPTTIPAGRRILHWCSPTAGGWSEWNESFEDIEGQVLVGSDGSTRGLTALASPRIANFAAAWEPVGKIWETGYPDPVGIFPRTGTTWSAAFARARCVEPLWITPPHDLDPYTNDQPPIVAYMRQDSCTLKPRQMASDFLSYQTVPFGVYIVGTGVWFNQV